MFWPLFWVSTCNFFKMTNLFAIFASEDGAEKCPKDAEDAEVGKLCRSALPHPARCPVRRESYGVPN